MACVFFSIPFCYTSFFFLLLSYFHGTVFTLRYFYTRAFYILFILLDLSYFFYSCSFVVFFSYFITLLLMLLYFFFIHLYYSYFITFYNHHFFLTLFHISCLNSYRFCSSHAFILCALAVSPCSKMYASVSRAAVTRRRSRLLICSRFVVTFKFHCSGALYSPLLLRTV